MNKEKLKVIKKVLTKGASYFIIKVSESKYSKIFFYHEDILKIIKDYLNNFESNISELD